MDVSQRNVNNEVKDLYTANVHSHCASDREIRIHVLRNTGGTLHLTSLAPYILCCSGLGCTLNGKFWDLNPGFLVEGFLWVAFPPLVEKRKNFTATFSFYPSSFVEIVGQIPLKALRFATTKQYSHWFHLGALAPVHQWERSTENRAWMWTWGEDVRVEEEWMKRGNINAEGKVKTRCQTGCFFIYELAGGGELWDGYSQPLWINKKVHLLK